MRKHIYQFGLASGGIWQIAQEASGALHALGAVNISPRWFKELRARTADLALGRLPSPLDTDIDGELLYHEQLVVVAGPRSKWLRQRKIRFTDLANESWLLPPPGTLVASLVADAFGSHDMEFPPKGAATGPINLLFALLANGPFLLAMSRSLLQLGTHLPPLKVLPVEFPSPPWPVGIMTVKNRTQTQSPGFSSSVYAKSRSRWQRAIQPDGAR